MEPDLIMWVIEAQDYISRPKTMKWAETPAQGIQVQDNKIPICVEWQMIECVSLSGVPLIYDPTRSCGGRCTQNCESLYIYPVCQNEQQWLMDECYIHFDPLIGDDKFIHVKALQRAMGTDGYPLIFEVCATAIADYVMWKVCFRFRDNRAAECKRDWFFHKRTAFAELNRYTQQQLQNLGLAWFAPLYHYNANNGWVGGGLNGYP